MKKCCISGDEHPSILLALVQGAKTILKKFISTYLTSSQVYFLFSNLLYTIVMHYIFIVILHLFLIKVKCFHNMGCHHCFWGGTKKARIWSEALRERDWLVCGVGSWLNPPSLSLLIRTNFANQHRLWVYYKNYNSLPSRTKRRRWTGGSIIRDLDICISNN